MHFTPLMCSLNWASTFSCLFRFTDRSKSIHIQRTQIEEQEVRFCFNYVWLLLIKDDTCRAYTINSCLSPQTYPEQIEFQALENTLLSGLVQDGKAPRDSWVRPMDKLVKDSVMVQCFPLYSILLSIGNPTVSKIKS